MQRFATTSHAAPAFQVSSANASPCAGSPLVRTVLRGPRIQPKLTVGAVNDPAEHEADHVASQVMRMPDRDVAAGDTGAPSVGSRDGGIRRLCADCEKEQQGGTIQRRATGTDTPNAAPPGVRDILRSPGRPLDAGARAFMEPRFGRDFGDVRIHTGPKAAESARSIQALAYTSGRDVVFGAGQYAPETASGRHVLAHELTHVVQQNAPSDERKTVRRQPDPQPEDTSRPSSGTPPYREATEFNECVRILGEGSSEYCAQTVMGVPPGPWVAPSVKEPLILTLDNVGSVPRSGVVEATIRQSFEPIVKAAGRTLQFNRFGAGHLTLTFSPSGHENKPCDGGLILGDAGLDLIKVGAHEDLRVCSEPQGDPTTPPGLDYAPGLDRVFNRNEVEFGQFVGTTAVHEFAHNMANLQHTSDPNNVMFAVEKDQGAYPPKSTRTLPSMRKFWSEQKSFSSDQIARLQEAIRTGIFDDGVTTTSAMAPPGPTAPPISVKKPRTPPPPTPPKKP